MTMDWQMISLFGLLPAFAFGYAVGRGSIEYPSDEEMFRRLVASRSRARTEREVERDLEDEINRQAART
jgi:hypothetical protein